MNITANNLVAGQTVIINKRAYKVMNVTLNFGAFGDYAAVTFLDIKKDRYTAAQNFELVAEFEVVA